MSEHGGNKAPNNPSNKRRGNPAWKKGGPSPNPNGRRGKKRNDSARGDGWLNVLTGLGDPSRDKRQSTMFSADFIDDALAMELWRGDDLAARGIETWPNEMLREGFEIRIDDKTLAEEIAGRLDDLGLTDALWTAIAYERAYGGSGILLGANDGAQDLKEPLNLKEVRSFDWLTVLEPRDLTPLYYYADPRAKNFGRPAIYQLAAAAPGQAAPGQPQEPGAIEVHESRLVTFDGIRVSRHQTSANNGWGDSVFTRVWRVLRNFNMSWESASALIDDFAQAVLRMEGLAAMMAQDQDGLVKKRIETMDMMRSVLRMIVMDKGDEWERKPTPLTGLPELLDRFMTRLAAAFDMPLTLLMGMSPAGLNATGESDIRFFYDRVKSQQAKRLKPTIERIIRLIMASMRVQEPDNWTIRFRPLWQPTDKEQTETRRMQAEADKVYLEYGVVTPAEIAISRFGAGGYSLETTIDIEERQSSAEAEIEAARTEASKAAEE